MQMPVTKFSEFARHRKEFIRIDDFQTYTRARVQLHWRGIVERDRLEGAAIKTKNQQVARTGELLVAEIDAKVGGIGIVPPELDEAVVSSHYFLFDIDETKCLRKWLDFFIRSGALEDQVAARGSTNYAAIRPQHVLAFQMPLPSIPEQRRIVARIEELSAKIEEPRRLRRITTEETEALPLAELSTLFRKLSGKYGTVRLEELLTEAGYGSSEKCDSERMGGGTPVLRIPNVASERITLEDLKYARLSVRDTERLSLSEGDILVVRTNGSLQLVGRSAVVPNLDERFAFASYMIRLRFNGRCIAPEYAQRMLQHLRVSGALVDFARTTAGQYNVSLGRLRSAEIPVPPLPEQRRTIAYLDDLQAKVDAVKKLQKESEDELNALMPSILSRAFAGEL
jgi:type I restriction enzyme, S subunit